MVMLPKCHCGPSASTKKKIAITHQKEALRRASTNAAMASPKTT